MYCFQVNNFMKPLLSVAIATKNREYYCIKSVETILKLNDSRIEIAIADNSSTKEIYEFIEKIKSPQIKYTYTDSKISSIDNFNRAVELCSGEYITLIGDDDVILMSMIKAAEWMKENGVETLSSKRSQRYYWPKSRPQSPNGTLDLFKFSESFEKIDAKQEIIKAAKTGLHNFYDYKVAKSYHGLVKKSLMDEIKRLTGNYYGALSPDVFSVMTLSYLTRNHYFINYPLSIMGVCRDSTSAHQIYGEHVGKLENMPHLKNRPPYDWDYRVPRYYCVSNTWAESGINALEQVAAKDVLSKINIYPIAAMGILMNRKYIFKLSVEETEKMRRKLKINYVYFWTRIFMSGLKMSTFKIINIIRLKFNNEYNSLDNIADIEMAQKICETKYNKQFFNKK